MKAIDTKAAEVPENISKTLGILKQVSPYLFIIDAESLLKAYPRYQQLEENNLWKPFFTRLKSWDITEEEIKRLLEIEAVEIVADLVRDPIYLREPNVQDQQKVAIQRKMSRTLQQIWIYSDIQELNALLEKWWLSKCQIPNKLEQELKNTLDCIEKILKGGEIE